MSFLADLDAEINWYKLHYETDEALTPFGRVSIVEEAKIPHDGYEGGDGTLTKVVRLAGIGGDTTYLKTGYYQSYEGAVWDGPLVQVEKREITREEWVEI